MSAAAATKTAKGNEALASRLAKLFRSEEDADCEVAFVREGDPSEAQPLSIIAGHSLVLRYSCEFFKAQVRNARDCTTLGQC